MLTILDALKAKTVYIYNSGKLNFPLEMTLIVKS